VRAGGNNEHLIVAAEGTTASRDAIHGKHLRPAHVESCEPYHQRWLRERPEDCGDDVRFPARARRDAPRDHNIQAQRYRALLRAQFLDAFDDAPPLLDVVRGEAAISRGV
jgi:hypothetical protein